MIRVSLLGAGNVATHFFKAIKNAKDVSLVQWYNRDLKKITTFKNDVDIIDDISNLSEADLYILAVSDAAISDISASIPFENKLVVHTSGSVNIHDLDKKNRRGVFYPLQTFSKDVPIDFQKVPICIEAS